MLLSVNGQFGGIEMKNGFCAIFLSITLAMGSTAEANVVFEDDFDTEVGSGSGASNLSEINYTGFANWIVAAGQGSVDLVHHGDFGPIDCFGGSGQCVDLDGTTNNAGTLVSTGIGLMPGLYRLELYVAGTSSNFNQAAASQPNSLNVSVGSFIDTNIQLDQGDPFTLVSELFAVNGPSGGTFEIVITHEGGDNFGAILDNVSITAVPLPAALYLFSAALTVLSAGPIRSKGA